MHKSKPVIFVVFMLCTILSCGRKTSDKEQADGEAAIELPAVTDTTSITAEEPFRNQPNELCTIIRKLDISQYSPTTVVEDVTTHPMKYCLLDICLETIDEHTMTISLGEEGETVTTTYQLITIFEDEETAKIYAEKYKIGDVKWD